MERILGINVLEILFYVSMLVFFFVYIGYTILRKHDYFNSATYITIGVCVPLILYLCRWSYVIIKEPSNGFYWIYICLFICSVVFQLTEKREFTYNQKITVKHKREPLVLLVNVFWMLCVLINNKYCSGAFFPALSGIDNHVDNAPIIMYFVRSTYAVIALDVIFYFTRRKKIYLLYAALQVVLPVVSSAGRMVATEAALCGVSLFFFLWLCGYGKKKQKEIKRRRIKTRHVLVIAILAVGIIYALVEVGEYRASHFGAYQISYADSIGYTGPLGEIGAWLYGYFAISCNNLNQTILANAEQPNFIGLYSFASFFFGILQLDNFFGLDSGAAQAVSVFTLGEATVPTGLWTFYYDYYILAFIPMIVAFIKEHYIRRAARRSNKRLVWIAVYFYYIPEWFFMGFTNTIFSVTGITTGVITYVLLSMFFERESEELMIGATGSK